MNNEQYLLVSYFAVGAVCAGLGVATFALLRRSFAALTSAVAGGRLGRVLRRLFFVGLVLPSMAGFFSVAFTSCDVGTYKDVIADRSYLVLKNEQQLSSSLSYIAIALLVWAGILAAAFVAAKRRDEASG